MYLHTTTRTDEQGNENTPWAVCWWNMVPRAWNKTYSQGKPSASATLRVVVGMDGSKGDKMGVHRVCLTEWRLCVLIKFHLIMMPSSSPHLKLITKNAQQSDHCSFYTYQRGPAPGGLASDGGWRIWLSTWRGEKMRMVIIIDIKRPDRQRRERKRINKTGNRYIKT